MATAVLSSGERGQLRVARESDASPYDRVMSLGYDSDAALLALFMAGAAVAQAAFGFVILLISLVGLSMFANDVRGHIDARLAEVEIEITRDEVAPKPTVEPEVKEAPPVTKDTPRKEAAPPQAAAPAAAGKVIAATDDPNTPVDLTNTVVVGSAESYGGGNSANNGTSTTPVRATAIPGGVPGGTGTSPTPASIDRSRGAGLLGSTDWNCSFPAEADVAQIDEAVVKVQVSINADGAPQTVKVLADPGSGFGGAAIRCAKRQRFRVALDRDGNAQAGTTNPFNIRFSR